jgi:hypothetical protein
MPTMVTNYMPNFKFAQHTLHLESEEVLGSMKQRFDMLHGSKGDSMGITFKFFSFVNGHDFNSIQCKFNVSCQ